jgi:hypothetical protein
MKGGKIRSEEDMYVQSAFKCSAQCTGTGENEAESKSEGENSGWYSKYGD